ncbi:MAG TPA: hypothetical protein VFS42_08030, partial [Burkholderiaceae bacterium]|nr:hypothetical protein [Burkholderiaceae bacterium]
MFMSMQNAARVARRHRARVQIAAVLFVVSLVACGGGGGSDGQPSAAQSASSNTANDQAFAVSRIDPANGETHVVPERLLSVQLSRE